MPPCLLLDAAICNHLKDKAIKWHSILFMNNHNIIQSKIKLIGVGMMEIHTFPLAPISLLHIIY